MYVCVTVVILEEVTNLREGEDMEVAIGEKRMIEMLETPHTHE